MCIQCFFPRADDSSEKDDPLFIVPLVNAHIGHAPAVELCYEIDGFDGVYYNMISDHCYSVNARYTLRQTMGEELNVIDQVTVHTARTNGHCVDIVIELDGPTCVTTVNEAVLGENHFNNGGVEVWSFRDKALVTVPSCGKEFVPVEFIVKCREFRNTNSIEFQVQNGRGISPDAHGLIGQPCLLHKSI